MVVHRLDIVHKDDRRRKNAKNADSRSGPPLLPILLLQRDAHRSTALISNLCSSVAVYIVTNVGVPKYLLGIVDSWRQCNKIDRHGRRFGQRILGRSSHPGDPCAY